jgi:dTDP-L-rhamnose 4-epimerase
MTQRILITGGAGFIGRRLVKVLSQKGYKTRILDNLSPQVHGPNAKMPADLIELADARVDDVTDSRAVRSALNSVDVVVHLAAETGPAQSLYEIEKYMKANVEGMAVLLQEMLFVRKRIKKIVVASSRAIYGEGSYHCVKCGRIASVSRDESRLSRGEWEPFCPQCGAIVQPLPTDEQTLPSPTSIYAVGKLAQEQMGLVFGNAYGIPAIALRYQNVYGPGQSLRNPYIGILSIFCARAMKSLPIGIYEDGKMIRDFVHVDDVVSATVLAIENEGNLRGVFNVGCGYPSTIFEVARKLVQTGKFSSAISVTGEYRVGDVRHNYADLTKIEKMLGYKPQVDLDTGLRELILWAQHEPESANLLESATTELANAGLFRKASQI